MNARTNDENYFITNDNTTNLNVPNDYEKDLNFTQFSKDRGRVNSFGHKLLDMCKSTGLRIVNGCIVKIGVLAILHVLLQMEQVWLIIC